jgi:polyisoprenoid-binding protein YceI
MKPIKLAPVLLALLAPFAADAKLASAGSSSVTFAAAGPAGMRIVGATNDLSVSDDSQNVTVTVPLANLKTGIDLRDHHMRDKYLEIGKYPNAELVVAKSAIRMPPAGGDASGDASGTMKLHGKTKAVTFHYVARRDGGAMKVGGTVHVDMRDYGIDVPSYMGITVKPDVDVEVKFGVSE